MKLPAIDDTKRGRKQINRLILQAMYGPRKSKQHNQHRAEHIVAMGKTNFSYLERASQDVEMIQDISVGFSSKR